MEAFKLEAGENVEITTNSKFYKDVYKSIILSVATHCIELSSPTYNGLVVPLNIGLGLNVKVNTPQGILEFSTEVIDRNIETHSLLIKSPEDKPDVKIEKNINPSHCKFITITSGKGGVGKTSFIINYSIALAKRGKKVVILDADLGMANVDILLKITPEYNLINVIDGSKTLQEIILAAPGGIKIIPGGSGIQELAYLTEEQFARITTGFYYLSKNFDYVFIDTGAGLSKSVTDFIFASDETIIITTPEPHAITDAYSIIKVILANCADARLKIMINKCESIAEGNKVVNKITKVVAKFLEYDIIPMGFMLENKIVTRSIKEQTPFYITYQNSEPSKNLDTIVTEELGYRAKNLEIPSEGISGFITKFKSIIKKNLNK